MPSSRKLGASAALLIPASAPAERTASKARKLPNEEISIPLYYTVCPTPTDEQISKIQHALSFTPISCVFVTNSRDIEVARLFSEEILKTSNMEEACELAKQSVGFPCVVIGESTPLKVFYSDGTSDNLVPDVS
jgi:hypothetical protein